MTTGHLHLDGFEPVRHRWRRILSPVYHLEGCRNHRYSMESSELKKSSYTNGFFDFLGKIRCRSPPSLNINFRPICRKLIEDGGTHDKAKNHKRAL